MNNAISAYKNVQVDAAVLAASPHELVRLLLSRAIELTGKAKVLMQKGDVNAKGEAIKLAIAIISDGLRGSLNMEAGGDIAANLDALYDYMTRQLLKAHAENDAAIFDEVASLLESILDGWQGIKHKQQAATELQPQI